MRIIGVAIAALAAFAGFLMLLAFLAVIGGWIVWLLWTPVAVVGLGLPALSFWQCVGLSYICGVLFKSSGSNCNTKS